MVFLFPICYFLPSSISFSIFKYMMLSYEKNHSFVRHQLILELKCLLRVIFLSSIFITSGRGHGWRGQVPNYEVSYHEHNVQDVMIKYLQRQVVELTHCLTPQHMKMNYNIDGCDLESNFKNPYRNLVLF
jgi:hypothetical protein